MNESAKIVSSPDKFCCCEDLRREFAALPDTAPYATWAKWFLSTDPARSIAPGFTITATEAEKLAQEMAAAVPAPKP